MAGESRRVLITGGAGFIGSHLADALIERGFRVQILDNLSTGQHRNLNPTIRSFTRRHWPAFRCQSISPRKLIW